MAGPDSVNVQGNASSVLDEVQNNPSMSGPDSVNVQGNASSVLDEVQNNPSMSGPDSVNVQGNASSVLDEVQKQTFYATGCTSNTRHARWTRQETIMLIQAKVVIENRAQKRSRSSSLLAPEPNEPKWDSVSSYCKQNGVIREPVQCQKRWSHLLADFRRIKTWESQIKKEAESFWMMSGDMRRERKLPVLFDKEVYDILDGKGIPVAATPLAQIAANAEIDNSSEDHAVAAAEEGQENEKENGEAEKAIGQGNEKETIAIRSPGKTVHPRSPISGEAKEMFSGSIARTGSMTQEGLKRRRLSEDGSEAINLANILERNSNILSSQLEAQNINSQLDREQRKEQADSLVAVLSKLTDAIVRIANSISEKPS